MKIQYRKVSTLLLTGVIMGISLSSCKKDNEPTTRDHLIGTWDAKFPPSDYNYSATLTFSADQTLITNFSYCYAPTDCYSYGYTGTWALIADDTKLVTTSAGSEPDTIDILSINSSSMIIQDGPDFVLALDKVQ